MRLGELTGISATSLTEAFELESKDTIVEGARLRVKKIPGRIACGKCGYEGGVARVDADEHHGDEQARCPKCGGPVAVIEGAGWVIESTKVVTPEKGMR